MGALFAFLGGSAFRLIFGEISHWITSRQEHKYEIERLELQGRLDAAQHERNLAAIKLQAEQQVKVIEVQGKVDVEKLDVGAWAEAVAAVGRSTGIKFLDTWNGSIRPALATVALAMVVFQFIQHGFTLTDWDRELVGGILGIYVADRQLAKRGK